MTVVGLDDILRLRPRSRVFKRGARRYATMSCPYHDDNRPSLIAYDDETFRCLACGQEGILRDLYNDLKRESPKRRSEEPASVSWNAPKLPTTREGKSRFAFECHDVLMKHDSLCWYLEMRGVSSRIEPCVLGWHNGWYTIPVTNPDGEVEGLILRADTHVEKASGGLLRFIQPSGQTAMMYVPNWHRFNTKSTRAVVYGMFDALALDELGYAVCTPTCGKGSFKPEWLRAYGGGVVFVPDLGEEEQAQTHASALGGRAVVHRLPYRDDLKDPADFLRTGRGEDLRRFLAGVMT